MAPARIKATGSEGISNKSSGCGYARRGRRGCELVWQARPALVLTLGGVNVDICALVQLQVLMLVPMLMVMAMVQVLVLIVTAMVQVMVQVLNRRRWRARKRHSRPISNDPLDPSQTNPGI